MTPAQVALNQRRLAAAYGKSALHTSFQAMVDEMRPKWDADAAKRDAGRAVWWAAQGVSANRPEPKPFTVDDYRRLVLAFDAGDLMSDHREEWMSASSKRDELQRLAKTFDPDFSIWREIDNNRRFK